MLEQVFLEKTPRLLHSILPVLWQYSIIISYHYNEILKKTNIYLLILLHSNCYFS